MPEITEVEVARKAVEDHCVGKKIVRVIIADDPIVIDGGISPSDFEASLLNKTIVAARRKGKNMWLQLHSPPYPSFQFGMAGSIYIKGVAVTKYKRSAVKDTDEWPSKYSKFFVELDDGLELSFTDKRRFARVRLLDDPTSVPPISQLGPDALEEPMNLDDFFSSLHTKKIGIKVLLLDQSFISGIGNWIADEVLYQARIHPIQSANSLSKEKCATLLKCINEVIKYAVQVDDDNSKFPVDWLFNFRWGKKPGKVNGREIEFIKAGGRTTAYVPELQKVSGAQALKAPAKIVKQASKRKKQESSDDGGSGEEGATSKEAEDTKCGQQDKRRIKNSSRRKKPTKIDDHANETDYEDSDIDNKKSRTKGKRGAGQAKNSRANKAPSKSKSREERDPDSEDNNSDGEYVGNQKGTRKATSKPQTKARNVSKKKETIGRNMGQVQKKAK